MRVTITAIVCAYNESRLLPACLYSVKAQTRPADDILVINNASTDQTAAVARAVPGVRVVDEPRKGLVVARETARRAADTTCWRFSTRTAARLSPGSNASRRSSGDA